MPEDNSNLQPAIRVTPGLIIYLNKTLDGNKDLNSLRELTAEIEKELTLVEEKLQKGTYGSGGFKSYLHSSHNALQNFPPGILIQRDDIILKWIFLPHKQSNKLKTCGKCL